MAAGVTDEIYALGMARRQVGFSDYLASMVLPVVGWTSGTLIGAAVGEVLPARLVSAFGVLLYAMFIAIVVPVAKASRPVLGVVAIAAVLGVGLQQLTSIDIGWRIIIVTLVAAAIGATVWPHHPSAEPAPDEVVAP